MCAQAGPAPAREALEAGSALAQGQQHDRLMKHLSRAQTRAALRRVCVLHLKFLFRPLKLHAMLQRHDWAGSACGWTDEPEPMGVS